MPADQPAAVVGGAYLLLLGPLPDLDLAGIDWMIVGGESGPGTRSMREEWVVGRRPQEARRAGVAGEEVG